MDAPEKIKSQGLTVKGKKAWSVRMRMNLHNNEAGRQVSNATLKLSSIYINIDNNK